MFAAILAVAVVAPAASAALRTTPRLGVSTDPFVVRGTGFKPGERVKVTLISGGGYFVHTTVALRRGTFAVRFARATESCAGYVATARGNEGTRASVKVTRECGSVNPDVIQPIDLTPKP